jgi:putative component of toxin-antitoxin plasmid stabilization module
VRKRDREQELVARERRAGRAPLQRDPRRGRGAMMAVRDVQSVERVQCRAQRLDLRSLGDAPDRVHDVVRPQHGEQRLRRRGRVDQLGERGVRAVRQQHGPGLRVQRCDVSHAVVLLVGLRELVTPDPVRLVGRD